MFRVIRKSLKWLILGGIGALVALLVDPDRGRARRVQMKDRAGAMLRRGKDRTAKQVEYTTGKVEGAKAVASGAGRMEPEDDIDISHGVKQAFAGLDFPTDRVTVEVVGGKVTLRGQVDEADQMERLEKEVRGVPGVRDVESLLHLPGEPAPNKAPSLGAS